MPLLWSKQNIRFNGNYLLTLRPDYKNDINAATIKSFSWISFDFFIDITITIHVYFSAPSQPPVNIGWTLKNSKIFLHWQHVMAMDNESEVTGYKVRFVVYLVLLYNILYIILYNIILE